MSRLPNTLHLWDNVLEDFKSAFPQSNSVIAGGAVRDFLMNNEAKDLDLFASLNEECPEDEIIHRLETRARWTQVSRANLPELVFDGFSYGWWIGIILNNCEDQYYAVKGFDNFIGRSYYDGRTINIFPEAWHCMKTNTWGPDPERADPKHFETVNQRLGGILSYE